MNNNKNEINFALESIKEKKQEKEELPSIAKDYLQKKKNIIPPVGIANPELVDSFLENMGDEEKIKKDVEDLERYAKETKYETAKRETLSHGARFLEGMAGGIGSFLNLLSGEAYFDEKGEMLPSEKVKMAPSATELREVTKSKTGKYLEPKGKVSENSQEFLTDVGSSAWLPGLGAVGKILVPMAGQSLKALVKNQGGTETQGDMAKLGLMGITTLANIGNAPKFAGRLYNEAINMMPQGVRISANPTVQAFNKIKNTSWYKTGRTTSKGPAMDEMARIESAIQHGELDAHDAMQLRRDINEARDRLGAFGYEPGIDKRQARKFLDEVDEGLMGSLENYGNRSNPKWLKNYKTANEAYRVTNSSRQLQEYISSHPLARPLQSQTAKTLFHLGGASAISHVPSLLGAAAPLAASAKSIQIINRMIRSSALRNYYLRVLSEASLGNAGAMKNALDRFDKVASKMEAGQKSSSSSPKQKDQANAEK